MWTVHVSALSFALPAQLVQAEVVMFTVVFVLLTLLVNAPMLPLILRWTRLNVVPPQVLPRKACMHCSEVLIHLR